MPSYLEILIDLNKNTEAEICIALLDGICFEGFEERENQLAAFIREDLFDELTMINALGPYLKGYSKTSIPVKNWNEQWEKSFEPVVVDDFCSIRASFHPSQLGTLYELIITPRMSFGTGHHPSTVLMIKAMSGINFKGKSVLDFGTGTGVLAILAEKLGAAEIIALDSDDWSITNAKENLAENNCTNVLVKKAESLQGTGVYDIILANINKNIIQLHFNEMQQHLNEYGVLIVSGLLESDLFDMEHVISANRFKIEDIFCKEEWISLVLRQ